MRYLYALYDRSGVCLYVGNSSQPKSRMRSHLRPRNTFFGANYIPFFCGMVLRACASIQQAAQVEVQIIRAYQRRGEAQRNRTTRIMGNFKPDSRPDISTRTARFRGRWVPVPHPYSV